MSDARQLLVQLLKDNQISLAAERQPLLDAFLQEEPVQTAINTILQQQHLLMVKWKLQERIAAIVQQPVRIPNATVGKPYEARLDFEKLGWNDLTEYSVQGLEELGLSFDKEHQLISGVPLQSGDKTFLFRFKIEGQADDAPLNEKKIPFIINPDPKSLWKALESNRDDPYWKEDDVTVFAPLGDRRILVSSKRGRSHANVGSFREDDFAFSDLENGWSIVVVADGAGSAKISRKGSAIACNGIVDHFKESTAVESMAEFHELLQQYITNSGEDTQKKLNRFVYNNLGKAAFGVHKALHQFAQDQGFTLKDLSTTLVFTLFKKYEAGYALLSFGVGDCPIAVLNRDMTEVILMNWIDVGEFGGGTRFITMPEIFQSEKFATRFGFKLVKDFSYLVLMSDGIYDPKFVVEAALAKIENWQAFFRDLDGQNEDGVKVELKPDNPEIAQQFSKWMDFWSPGNHDDRTLAIVF
jgi:serine/threonine protein phosphatase PrpC